MATDRHTDRQTDRQTTCQKYLFWIQWPSKREHSSKSGSRFFGQMQYFLYTSYSRESKKIEITRVSIGFWLPKLRIRRRREREEREKKRKKKKKMGKGRGKLGGDDDDDDDDDDDEGRKKNLFRKTAQYFLDALHI